MSWVRYSPDPTCNREEQKDGRESVGGSGRGEKARSANGSART